MTQQEINNSSMLKVGTILHGTYRIDSYLSSGGFGNTYVATNVEFDERVAIKEFFMKGVTQRDDNQTTVSVSNAENSNSFLEQKEKFKKEARRIRQLKNEHIVSVHDLFEENGTAYYVMDYVDGENLAERMKRTGNPMSEQEVRAILPQILDALKCVHDEGMWHLDLKPANIMLDKAGNVKLIDFGASKQLNAQKGGATTSTAISYTNGYAPREQMEQNYDKFGPWTDIYALGATLYNLLTNKRPSLPTDIDDDINTDKHISLPLPTSTSVEMRQLVLKMMQTNRLQRPQSIEDISELSVKRDTKNIINDESTIMATSDSMPDEETIIKEGTPSVQAQEKQKLYASTLMNTVDYLKQPFKTSVISIISIVIVICIASFFIGYLFPFDFDSFKPLFYFSDILYCIASIVLFIPFIIGIREVSKSISILLTISQCIIIARVIFNLYLYSTDDLAFNSQRAIFYFEELAQCILIGGYYFLNWGLLYCNLILYLVCGVLMVKNYNGKLKTFGGLFTLYALLTIIMNAFSTVSSIIDWCLFYELFVWGIYILWVYGMWWMLTRKPIDIKE